MKVLGIKQKSGEFNGRPWAHTAFYCECTQPDEITADFGHDVQIIKIKDKSIASRVEIGYEYKFYYDRFGNVIDAVLFD